MVAVSPLLRTCGTVVHLASTTTPGSSARNPIIDSQENLLPATRLLETMAHAARATGLVSSGGSIYGNPDELPVRETQRPNPLSFHAAGKIALRHCFPHSPTAIRYRWPLFAHPTSMAPDRRCAEDSG